MKISDSMLNFGQGKEIFVRFSSFNGFYTILEHKKDRKNRSLSPSYTYAASADFAFSASAVNATAS